MMKQPNPRHAHHHVVLIRRPDDLLVPGGTATLGDVRNTAFGRSVDVVSEGKERVAGQAYPGNALQTGSLLRF